MATVPLSIKAQLRGHSLCCGNGPWEELGSGLNSLILVLEEDLKAIRKLGLEVQCRAGHPAPRGIAGVNLGSSGSVGAAPFCSSQS